MRKLIKVPNPLLHEVSKPVKVIDGYVKEVAAEMIVCLASVTRIPCLGLAAVQLGEPIRVIVIMYNMYSRDFRHPVLIINPELVKRSEKMVNSLEGCLSIGDGTQTFTVKRYKQVKVVGIDLDGKRIAIKEHSLPAFALQYEIDHLDGKLVSDISEGGN